MRIDKLLVAIGICVLYYLSISYVSQGQSTILLWLHFIMTVAMLICTFAVMWHGNAVNIVGGVFLLRYTVTAIMGMARVIRVSIFNANDIMWCYAVLIASVFIFTLGFVCTCSYLFTKRIPHKHNTLCKRKYNNSLQKKLYIMLVFASAITWIINVAVQGGVQAYFSANYGIRTMNTPPYMLAIAMMVEFPLYYLTWGIILSPRFSNIKCIGIIWVVWSIIRFIVEGRTGFILLSLIIPTIMIYYKHYKNIARVRRIMVLAIILFLIGIGTSYTVRFNRLADGANIINSKPGVVEQIILSSTFDACENLIRINTYYKDSHMNGINVISPFVNWIPRRLWPEKPVMLGRRIVIDIYGAPSDTVVSFPPHLLGDFCADFGILGIIILPFIVGMIFGLIDNRYSRKREHMDYVGVAEYVAYGIASSSMCNSFSSGLIGVLYMIPFWVLWGKNNRVY